METMEKLCNTNCIVINKTNYIKKPIYSWTRHNESGGSFSVGGFKSLKECKSNLSQNISNNNLPLFLNVVDWDHNKDKPIFNITQILK